MGYKFKKPSKFDTQFLIPMFFSVFLIIASFLKLNDSPVWQIIFISFGSIITIGCILGMVLKKK